MTLTLTLTLMAQGLMRCSPVNRWHNALHNIFKERLQREESAEQQRTYQIQMVTRSTRQRSATPENSNTSLSAAVDLEEVKAYLAQVKQVYVVHMQSDGNRHEWFQDQWKVLTTDYSNCDHPCCRAQIIHSVKLV